MKKEKEKKAKLANDAKNALEKENKAALVKEIEVKKEVARANEISRNAAILKEIEKNKIAEKKPVVKEISVEVTKVTVISYLYYSLGSLEF